MAAFQHILHLIVLSGFVLPGFSLSPSPSVVPIWNPSLTTRLQLIAHNPSQDFTSPNNGRADMEDLELYRDGNGTGGYTDQVMPVEEVDGGYRRLVEGSRGQRMVEGKWGGNDATIWSKPADASTELLRQETYNGDTGSSGKLEKRRWSENSGQGAEGDKEKRKWGDNSMRVWGKRAGSGAEKRKWGDNSMNVWGKRVPTETDKRKWGDNSMGVWGKRSQGGNEKRKWGDNSMNVWGKRSNSDKMTSEDSSTSGRTHKTAGVDNEHQQVTHAPSWVIQKKMDLAKDTESSQSHRILSKRSILDHKPRYDWIVEELSKKSLPRWRSQRKQYDGPKRNWETNTMRVWGKRGLVLETIPNWDDSLDEESEALDGKRSWTSDNAIRVWGKRNSQLEPNGIWKDLLDSYES